MSPAANVTRRPDWLLAQLPMGMLDDDFFVRFVSMFQEVATTLLDDADNIANIVDLTVAPPELVRWLGSWMGLTALDPSLDGDTQRRVVRDWGRNLVWRGTRRGLVGFLESITGDPAGVEESGRIVREEDAAPRAPSVRITVTNTGWLSADDFLQLVFDQVPANVALEVVVAGQRIWPTPDGPAGPAGPTGGSGIGPDRPPGGPDPDGEPAGDVAGDPGDDRATGRLAAQISATEGPTADDGPGQGLTAGASPDHALTGDEPVAETAGDTALSEHAPHEADGGAP